MGNLKSKYMRNPIQDSHSRQRSISVINSRSVGQQNCVPVAIHLSFENCDNK